MLTHAHGNMWKKVSSIHPCNTYIIATELLLVQYITSK